MSYGFEEFVEHNLRQLLREELEKRRKRNPRYSLRAFSRDLRTSHSALSELLSGKRKLTAPALERIMDGMSLPETRRAELRAAIRLSPNQQLPLDAAEIRAHAHWYYPAILELTLVRDFQPDPRWIARRLGLRLGVARAAVRKLLEGGKIRIDSKGRWIPTAVNTTTLGQLAAAKAIQLQQVQFIEKHLEATRALPVDACSNMGLTVAMDPADLPMVRKVIYGFIRELSDKLDPSARRAKEVFRLNVGFFPVTRSAGDSRGEPSPRKLS